MILIKANILKVKLRDRLEQFQNLQLKLNYNFLYKEQRLC